MKNILLASAALTALVLAAPAAQAQMSPGAQGGPDRKESPAATSPERNQPGAQPGMKGAAGENRSERGEMRPGGAPGAQRSAEEPHAGQPATGNRSERTERPSTAGAPDKEHNDGNVGKAAQSPTGSHDRNADVKANTSHEPGRAERRDEEKPKSAQTPGSTQDRNAESKAGATKPDTGRADMNDKAGGARRQTGETDRTTTGSDRTGATADVGARGGAKLDEREQTKVRDFVGRDPSARLDRVDFDLTIGVRVPEHVRYRPLPSELVTIFPQYRGYDYVVANEEIVIIEPRTRKIVTVVAAGGEGRGRVPAHHAKLSSKQEKVVYSVAMRGAHPVQRTMQVTVGQRIPADIELAPLPQVIVQDAPDFRDYRYFVVNREVVLVDPDTREIIDIIRE